MKIKSTLPLLVSLLCVACSPESEQVIANQHLSAVVDKSTVTFVEQQPTLSTMLAIEPAKAGGTYNDRLPNYSIASMQNLQSEMRYGAIALHKIDDKLLSKDNVLHKKVVTEILNYYAGDADFGAGYIDTWAGHLPYIINQISGPLIDVPKVMQEQQAVVNQQDARDYLARLSNFDGFVVNVLNKYQDDLKSGVVLPKNLHVKTLAFFDSFLAAAPAEHGLVTSFKRKLQDSNIDEATQQTMLNKAVELVESMVYPAYQRARATVVASETVASTDDGIWAQVGGEKFYLHAIQYLGDSTLSADAIHELGLSEVERISQEMDSILKANGFNEGSVGERMVALAKEPQFLYADSDEGRQVLLADLNLQVKAVMAKAPQFYHTIPTQQVEVKRIPQVSEAGEAGGFYSPPSLDGKRSGIYWINLRDMNAVPKFSLKTLTYHEAVPGHHFQIAINMAQQDIGLLRQNAPFNAYVEGWALYSELIAKEMGMYDNDPIGDLGRLQAELYRAVRLVVDTGLHRKKWSREQAIAYFHTTTGTSMTDVVAEVERYMAWPGQALGYKLGMLQFVELRKLAQNELADKFDIKTFHDVLLLPGARPMSIVRSDVMAWIASQK
ncbi:DUF885 domain-containing protein [Paraglaciecola hydrolytica]|uniref:Tat pathway signal protein n=1 Tax=Paraglaciecola hydrolytica TaxID=1799789 RepID=A0A136A688_9ALTE|nr:DUF885 domain-containing protein [Paraglaciecola hydrolytica]KXI30742.1 hypothetical protein AX660_04795 [Paraglaciecola hydrolytica]